MAKSGIAQTGCLAIQYDQGVLVACDSQLISYYRCSNFTQRFFRINETCALVSSGDYADLLWTVERLKVRQLRDDSYADGYQLDAPRLANLLGHVIYEQRMKPLLSKATYIVFGIDAQTNKPFSAMIRPQCTLVKNEEIFANGFCIYQTISVVRKRAKELRENVNNGKALTFDQAVELLKECIKLQIMVDKNYGFRYQMCDFNIQNGMKVSEDQKIEMDLSIWKHSKQILSSYDAIC
ncbi:MAG: Proteasome subunit beta type-4 [Marteilia pararefringens]